MRTVWLGLILISSVATAAPVSTVPELGQHNAHLVAADQGEVYRGAEPKKKVAALLGFGITDVLIIKNDVKGEVAREISELSASGLASGRVTHLPVPWRNINDPAAVCSQFVEALVKIREVLETPGRKLYFHCTMGEDRTGVLAGLIRQLNEGWTARRAFRDEMCARGYADGSGKPFQVFSQVQSSLTPIFLGMSDLVEQGRLSWRNLDPALCLEADLGQDPAGWACRRR